MRGSTGTILRQGTPSSLSPLHPAHALVAAASPSGLRVLPPLPRAASPSDRLGSATEKGVVAVPPCCVSAISPPKLDPPLDREYPASRSQFLGVLRLSD